MSRALPPPTPSAVDALVAELVAEGTVQAEGSFSLDREKAREKMRQFQLADPLEYLLQLVRAAVLQGATALEFRIDTDDMWLTFDGKPFTIEDFDELYGALFGRGQAPEQAARRHLALGVNAAMALRPRHLRVESGAAHLVARPEAADDYGPLPAPRPDTHVHVADRVRLAHVGRFFQVLRGALPERTLLAARAAFCPVPLKLNGERLDTGLEGLRARTATWIEHTEGPHQVAGGHGRPTAAPEPDHVLLVVAGVTIRTRALEGADGFTAVATAPDLRTDVSQADVVQDAALDALLNTVERVRLRSLGQLLAQHPADAPARRRRELERATSPAEGAWRRHYGDALAEQLLQHPLWPTLGGAVLSTAEVLARGDFSYVTTGYEERFATVGLRPEGAWATTLKLLATPPAEHGGRALFRRWFPQAVDRTDDLDRFLTTERNRRAWRRRLVDVRLPPGPWLARVEVEAGSHFGEVGLHGDQAERAVVRFAVQGCLLGERRPPAALAGLEAILHGPYTPTALCDEVESDAVLEAGLDAVAAALPALLDRVAAEQPVAAVPTVRAWLLLASEGDPVAGLRALLSEKPAPMGQSPAWLRGLGDGPSPLARVPLFKSGAGEPLTLADLAAQRRAGHAIRHVPPGRPPLAVPVPLVAAGADELKLLVAVFGAGALQSGSNLYAEAEQRARWLALARARPTVEVAGATLVARVPLARSGLVGEAALRFGRERAGARTLTVQLWSDGRPVETRALAGPVPGLVLAVEHPDFTTNFACDAVDLRAGAWPEQPAGGAPTPEALAARLAPALAEAVRAMCLRTDEGASHLRLVRALLHLVAPTDAHRAAWEGLHRTRPARTAEARYLEILRAGWGGDPETVAQAIAQHPDAPLPAPVPEAVVLAEGLLGPPFTADLDAPPIDRLLAAVPALGALPVFPTVEGDDWSLGRLRAAEKPWLHALLARSRPKGYAGPILLGTGPAMAHLRRVFGAEALVSASEWSKTAAAERVRAALAPHDGRLDPASVLSVHAVPGGGEVGLRRPYAPGRISRVRLVAAGRLVAEVETTFGAQVEAVVVDDALEAAITAQGVRVPAEARDRMLARVDAEVEGLLSSLTDELASGVMPDRADDARAHARYALVQRARGKARKAANLEADPLTAGLAGVPLFRIAGAEPVPLLALTRRREAGQDLALAGSLPSGHTPTASTVVLVDETERADLKALFGIVLPDYAQMLTQADAGARFDQRPTVPLELSAPVVVSLGKGGISGRLGLGAAEADRLEVHKRHRRLGVARLSLGLTGAAAVINDDEADAQGDWTQVVEGPRLDKARVLVAEAVPDLLAAAVAAPGDGVELRALAWSVVRCAVPTAAWAQLFYALVAARGADEGTTAYHDALRCLVQDTGRTLERIVKPLGFKAEKLMMAEGGPRHGRGDAFVRAIFGGWPLRHDGADVVARLISALPALGQVPLVGTRGGQWRTLAELAQAAPASLPYRLRPTRDLAPEVLVPPAVHWSLLEALLPGAWREATPAAGAPPAPAPTPAPATIYRVDPPRDPDPPAVVVVPRSAKPEPVAEPVAPAPVPPAPSPEPAAPPPPEPAPAPSPDAQLIETIKDMLRGAHADVDVDRLIVEQGDGRLPVRAGPLWLVVDLNHPLVALARGGDPGWVACLAACAFGALNRALVEVEDVHEVDFTVRLAAALRRSLDNPRERRDKAAMEGTP